MLFFFLVVVADENEVKKEEGWVCTRRLEVGRAVLFFVVVVDCEE